MKKSMLCCLLLITLLFPLGARMQSTNEPLSDDEIAAILYRMSQEENEDSAYLVLPDDYLEPVTGLDGMYRLLIVGVDTDDPRIRGRSDTMMLAVLDARNKQLKLISFMRDMYVQIPGHGHNRMNAAYVYGGAEALKNTLEKNFHVQADGYIAVNFAMMITLIDAIGGVDIEVEEQELKPLNGILEYYNYQNGKPEAEGRLEQAGMQHLSGLQAMSYARIRKIDGDYERVGRQQRVMMAIFNRMKNMQPEELMDIMMQQIDFVATDVTIATAVSMMQDVVAMDTIDTRYLRIPVSRSSRNTVLNKAYFIIPNLEKNQKAISEFLNKP